MDNKVIEFLNQLAESNKESEETISMIHVIKKTIESPYEESNKILEQLKQENESLKEETKKSKQLFYETFMKGGVPEPRVDEVEEKLNTTLKVDDLLKEIERRK